MANKELDRARSLITTQAIATNVLDQRAESQQGAEAAVAVASAALDRAKLDLDFTQVRAPITGHISRKLVSEGNLVAGGDANATLLTTIVSLDSIDAYFDIDEQSFLRYGRSVRREAGRLVHARRRGRHRVAGREDAALHRQAEFRGKPPRCIDRNAAAARQDRQPRPRARARPVRARLAACRAGTSGRACPGGSRRQRFLASRSCSSSGADDRVAARPVELGRLFGKMREVTRGLEPNDRVVVSGLQRVQAGTKVTVRTEAIKLEQFASKGDVL